MPIVRGFTGEIRTMPPDIYVNEMPVPQAENFTMPDFVLGFVGEFDRGPVNEYIYCSETPTKRMTEIVRTVLGEMSDDGYKGNQLLTHLHMARAKKAVFVRILGAGYATASLTLTDSQDVPEPTLKISAKYPGKYANIFTVEVIAEEGETFTLKLYSDLDGYETYTGLTMDKGSDKYAVKVINEKSYHFVLEDLESTAGELEKKKPSVIEQTQLSGGSDGAAPTATEYMGTFDNGTGKRTGLKLLELAGKQVTDFCYIGFSAPAADKALYAFGEKYNSMGYCGTNNLKAGATGEDIIAYRKTYDTDFCQMTAGNYKANTGAQISGACLSAIVHATGNVEDSGLACECTWIAGSDEEFDFDQLTFLYENQIGCFTLKPSETGQGNLGWRMGNDYTLAVKDVLGEVITDNENRKVNRRRLNSWIFFSCSHEKPFLFLILIFFLRLRCKLLGQNTRNHQKYSLIWIENSLFFVAAKWQGKAMTAKMKQDAEVRIRTFFDELKNPTVNPLENPKIEDYSITFDESAKSIDVFVQNINVKHFNTAEWVLLNFAGGTNAEIEV